MSPLTTQGYDAPHAHHERHTRSEELHRRRVDSLIAFVSFSLMLTILGLVFFALEIWHA